MPVKERTRFEADLNRFASMGGKIDSEHRCEDAEPVYAVDFQYLLMNRWAFDRLRGISGTLHDFASKVDFVAFAAADRDVIHYDIRKPDIDIPGVLFKHGDLTALPLPDASVSLASCLHVAEHVGLGRYGDEIDPHGFVKACSELSRVLAPGGSLFFAVPVGVSRVVFNAHRVLSSGQVLTAFSGLRLAEFSGISKAGQYAEDVPVYSLDGDEYGCGLFHFVKDYK